MLRRSFNITTHSANQVLKLAKQSAVRADDPRIAELMRRFRFSEEEARWALENVGMPE